MDDGEKGVYVQGMRVKVAQCGLWHKMEKKLVDIRNGDPDLIDEISDAKCCAMKIKEPLLLRKHEFGRMLMITRRSGFSEKKRITDLAQLFKWRLELKLMSVWRGWSD